MKIIEPDCYIEYKDGVYHLYLLKNKKELKETDENLYKLGGYFINIDNAFKEIVKFRKHKKYSFKEDWKPIKINLSQYLKHKKEFNNLLCKIYDPVKKLRNKLFDF